MELETRVSNIDTPQEVIVPTRGVERVVRGGLETITTTQSTRNKRRGYDIYGKICVACGAKTNHAHELLEVGSKEACSCGGRRFRVLDKLGGYETEQVINAKVQYKCKTCNETYDQPTPCCVMNNAIAPNGNELKDGFYCTGCSEIYDKKVNCCNEGRMIPGQYYMASREEYHARPKILLPA